ncbi:MAG: hypothetical protein JWN30_564 [Bacilli bacterium]|nr:hypothetical protein [Bacilli bacterium]
MPYACPNCRNRMRFYRIEQYPVAVKLDPQTGEMMEQVSPDDPLLIPYRGEMVRMQCGVCGIAENESVFAKRGQQTSLQHHAQNVQQPFISKTMNIGQHQLLPPAAMSDNRSNINKQFRL